LNRRLLSSFLALLALQAAPAPAQTNLRAWHANGQTFLVWDLGGPVAGDATYGVHRSGSPIGSLAGVPFVGRVFADGGANTRIAELSPGARWVLPDGRGGSYAVGAAEAYFVFTPEGVGQAYYAVVPTGETAVGADNTAGPVRETVDPVTCHVQHQDPDVVIFGHWIDGRADHDGGRPGYPAMGNEWSNGIGFNLALWHPAGGLPPGPAPLVIYIHGGYGYLLQLSGVAPFVVRDGLLATLDDPLDTLNPAGGNRVDQNTFWFGYQDGLNRFAAEIPSGSETVVDYTARRVWWETGWIVENFQVDPLRVSLSGPSMGGLGTALHTQLRPDLYSAGLAYVPLLAGPREMIDPLGSSGSSEPSPRTSPRTAAGTRASTTSWISVGDWPGLMRTGPS